MEGLNYALEPLFLKNRIYTSLFGNPMIPRALTIAGSDSGGGAGIQADLKTFASLGVHGMSAVTAITAQNTVGVEKIHDVPVDVIKAQIRVVMEDIGVDAVKTGMLHSEEIVTAVAEELKKGEFPIVVDPVMIAKSGAILLKPEAVEAVKREIIPIATVITPNRREAEYLAETEIISLDDARGVAKKLSELGPDAVIVKGGHIPTRGECIDILYWNGSFKSFSGPYIESRTDHGTGCTFSSAIAAELAKGKGLIEAVEIAKKFIIKSIAFGLPIGKGHGPVNPMTWLENKAQKYEVLEEMDKAIRILESNPHAPRIVPEVQMNLAMALPYATDQSEVAAIPGRIVNLGEFVKASFPPRFGASKHVSSAVLALMKIDLSFRSILNIRYSPEALKAAEELGYTVSFYDRTEEPEEVKRVEGATIPWGIRTAIEKAGGVVDIVYHLGDVGKEPMILVLGTSATNVVEKALKIAQRLS